MSHQNFKPLPRRWAGVFYWENNTYRISSEAYPKFILAADNRQYLNASKKKHTYASLGPLCQSIFHAIPLPVDIHMLPSKNPHPQANLIHAQPAPGILRKQYPNWAVLSNVDDQPGY